MNDVGLDYLTLSRAGAHALGRRVAAHRPRVGARRRADRDALRPRRADDRAARRRHAPPARDPAAAGRPRQHGGRRRARSGGDRVRRPRDRPRPRRGQPRRPAALRGDAAGPRARQGLGDRRAAAAAARPAPARAARAGARGDSGASAGARSRVVPFRRAEGAITIVGARQHNLQNLTVRVPLGRLVAVAGVSGSGKSTLVRDILHDAYARRVKGATQFDVGAHDRIDGLEGDRGPAARGPEPARPLGPLEPRDLHEGLGRDPPALRAVRAGRFPRHHRPGLLLQLGRAAAARRAAAPAGRRSTCSSWPT